MLINRYAWERWSERRRGENKLRHATLGRDELSDRLVALIDLWLIDGRWTIRSDGYRFEPR